MRTRHKHACTSALAALVLVVVAARPIAAGIADTPLPTFADAKPSVLVVSYPGCVKRGRLETEIFCTSFDTVAIDIGVEIFDGAGVLMNSIAAGAGAVLGVASGQTVTIATSTTATYLESAVIPIADGLQGSARVVASSTKVSCRAMLVDDAFTPPESLVTLASGVQPALGAVPASIALPQFSNGHAATHSAVFPGAVKRGHMETDVFCTSLASQAIDIGVEIFAPNGVRQNNVQLGNGAVLAVAPGATVTFGTTGTAAFLETTVILLNGVAQGLARVVSTSPLVTCTALMLDAAGAPPMAMSALIGSVLGGAAATPTATPSRTASPTPTRTSSATRTRTATATATASSTRTRTTTPVATLTPTRTSTFTPTRTPPFTATASATRTVTRTATASATATRTATLAPPGTASITATFSPTRTATASPTASRTFTRSATATATITATRTASGTATRTPTRSATRTASASPSPSVTATRPATPLATLTRSATATITATRTAGGTATRTPTRSATRTASASPSVSLTATRTATAKATVAEAGTATTTATRTMTATRTVTMIGTATTTSPIATPTLTATEPPSVTRTPSPGVTVTDSATPTPPFREPSLTPTSLLTAAPTQGLTPTSTAAPVACAGDCGGNGVVTVDELVQGVNIALDRATVDQCAAFDADGNRRVTINELVTAVTAALSGCDSFPFSNGAGLIHSQM